MTQDFEAKAREIADWTAKLVERRIDVGFGYFPAGDKAQLASVIASALSDAVRAEREAIARMLADDAESFAFEAHLHSDPSRTEILLAKGQSRAEAASAVRSRGGDANG